jgi:hypothetical protein
MKVLERFKSLSQQNLLLLRPPPKSPSSNSRWISILYRSTSAFLIILISLTLLAAAYDLTSQLFDSDRSTRVSDVIISLGVYPVLVSLLEGRPYAMRLIL